MVTQIHNPNKRETEAGRAGAQSQPGLHNNTLFRRDGGKEERSKGEGKEEGKKSEGKVGGKRRKGKRREE